jgi:anti-sigma B factor antagonist
MVSGPTNHGATVDADGPESAPVLHVSGELDLSCVEAARAAFDQSVTDAAERVELDLAGLDFLDSSGLSLFIELARRLPVTIVAASEPVRRIIGVTGLGETLGLPL